MVRIGRERLPVLRSQVWRDVGLQSSEYSLHAKGKLKCQMRIYVSSEFAEGLTSGELFGERGESKS